ncbi:MAG: site-specific integrase [bacterium]|nr:site-specific integrase [bacterium]MDE0416642.1 site-specific integrase [bacterium]
MPRRMRLSDRNVANLRAAAVEYTVWDTRVASLGVRVRPSAHRTFVHLDRRGGSSMRRTLGRTTLMTVDEARARCLDIQSSGTQRQTPAAAIPLFRDFVAGVWKPECYERQKPSTRRHADTMMAKQLLPAFGDVPLDRIDRRSVHLWFDRYSMTAPGGANRTLDVLCQIMNHAKVHGYVATNPASGVRRNPGRRPGRFLSRAEIRRLHDELDRCVTEKPSRAPQADIIRLLSLTGCRLSEIRTLTWQEFGGGTLDLVDGKTGPRTVYLSSKAREIIERQPRTESAYVFPSPETPSRPQPQQLYLWALVRRRAGIADVRLHDLRHNFASHAVMQGVPLPTVARLLGHRQLSMTLRYAHTGDRETEAAAERIGEVMSELLGEPAVDRQ